MKKLFSLLAIIGLTTGATITVVSCSCLKNKITIVMTPGAFPSTTFIKLLKPLEKGLYNEMKKNDDNFNSRIQIEIGTDAQTALQSIKAGTSTMGFISTNKYEFTMEGDSSETLAPLVIAMKNPMNADVNILKEENLSANKKLTNEEAFKIAKEHNKLIKNINFESEWDINKTIEKYDSNKKVKYYRSYVYVNNQLLVDHNYNLDTFNDNKEGVENYKKQTKELILAAAKTENEHIYMRSGAASSYHFPLLWMKEKLGMSEQELKLVAKNPKCPELHQLRDSLTKNKAMAFGLADIRALDNEKEKIKETLKNTTIIGVTDTILTEGIFYSKKWMDVRNKDTTFINNLRKSFKELVNSKKYRDIFEKLKIFDYDVPNNLDSVDSAKNWEKNYNNLCVEEKTKTAYIHKLINKNSNK